MSAWLCSQEHLSLLANAAGGGKPAFETLLLENLRSMKALYPGRDWMVGVEHEAAGYLYDSKITAESEAAETFGIEPRAVPPILAATLLLKQCECFDYQACESDDYKSTPAAALIEGVRQRTLAAGAVVNYEPESLYSQMPWGV